MPSRAAVLVVALALAPLVGCATPPASDAADAAVPASASGPARPSALPSEPARPSEPVGPEYRFRGTVVGDEDETVLCGAVVGQSIPPSCEGGLPLDWDWDTVSHRTEAGRSWGDFEVVGTWDGRTLKLTRPVRYGLPDRVPASWMRTPCPVPADGWVPPDPARADEPSMAAAVARAEAVEGYESSFADRVHPDVGPRGDVLTVRTHGDLAAMEAAVREVWGGPLCITPSHGLDGARLAEVSRELFSSDLPVLSTYVDPDSRTVDALVWVVTPQLQAEVDDRYGDGVVTVRGVLRPVD